MMSISKHFLFLAKTSLILLFNSLIGSSVHAQTDTIKVGYNIAPPFVEEENDKLAGPSIWLCEQLMEEHDLYFDFVQYPLDSMLIKLANGEIALCASPLTITSERSKEIDFTAPYYIAHSSILVPHHDASSVGWQTLKSFFSWQFFQVLGGLALVILIFGFLTWLFERKKNHEEFGNGIKGLWNGFWWSAVTMTTVGYGDMSPKTTGGRAVALIWMFTAVIIISGFTASIASALTADNIKTSEQSIEDFKSENIGTIKQSGTENWLTDNFYKQVISYSSMDACVEALEKGEIKAIAYDRPILRDYINTHPNKPLDIGKGKFNAQYYAMGMSQQLDPALRAKINTSILEQSERMDWKVLLSEYGLESD